MHFGEAVKKTKFGNKVARNGWNGKGMYIFDFYCSALKMKPDEDFTEEFYDVSELENIIQVGNNDNEMFSLQDFLVLKTAKNTCIPWTPSQEDQLANDWEVVE